MSTTELLTLDQAMDHVFDRPAAAVADALRTHRWALAHLVLVKAVPAGARRTFLDDLPAREGLRDPLALRMVAALLGKELGDRPKEGWPVSPMAHTGYFAALRPHYARFVALMAVGHGDYPWAQREAWLNEAVAQGLDLTDATLVRGLVLEASRCPHAEVWGWLNGQGLLAAHATVLLNALRERVHPARAQVERLLGRSTAHHATDGGLLDHDPDGAGDFQDLAWSYGTA